MVRTYLLGEKRLTLSELAPMACVSKGTLTFRLNNGWTAQEAISIPPVRKGRKRSGSKIMGLWRVVPR